MYECFANQTGSLVTWIYINRDSSLTAAIVLNSIKKITQVWLQVQSTAENQVANGSL